MKIWASIKRFLRWTGIILLSLILVANLVILVTGKFYLYKAVWYTYLHGQSGPGIYDQDYFYSRNIAPANKPDYWHEHPATDKVNANADIISEIEGFETTSILVIHQGQILFEKYWGDHDKDRISNSFSMAKSVISMLIGVAIKEEKIKSLDQKVSDFIPEFKKDGRDKLTIRNLLTMSAALDWSESGGNPFSDNAEAYYGWDLTGMIMDVNMNGEPGKTFDYQSGTTMILGYLLEKATGKNVATYASEKIWQPVGAETAALWSLDHEDGLEKAYCCYYATTRDFARLGRVMMDGGKWNGMSFNAEQQILSEEYVLESVRPATLKDENGKDNDKYGLAWWLVKYKKKDVFYARGILGQYVLCIPEDDLIIVRTGHKRGAKKEGDDHPSDIFVYMDLGFDLLKQL